jgi:hypothetical protein
VTTAPPASGCTKLSDKEQLGLDALPVRVEALEAEHKGSHRA